MRAWRRNLFWLAVLCLGSCDPWGTGAEKVCTADAECDDGNGCTDDRCAGGACAHPFNQDSCDDGDECTMLDQCIAGTCDGIPLDADGDGHQPESCAGDDCNDEDANVNPGVLEAYAEGNCADGVDNDCSGEMDGEDASCRRTCTVSAECDDGNPCTDDTCPDGVCVPVPNTAPCNDGDDCTMGDRCEGAVCTGQPLDADHDGYSPVNCNGSDCDDDDEEEVPATSEGDTAGECSDGKDNDCDGWIDADDTECYECTTDAECDDDDLCTDNICSDGSCIFPTNTAPCEDGDPCTENDVCFMGQCSPGTQVADGDEDGHRPEPCGLDCDDGDANVGPDKPESSAAGNCADMVDNDCDGFTDGADPGCPCTRDGVRFDAALVVDILGGPVVDMAAADFNLDSRTDLVFLVDAATDKLVLLSGEQGGAVGGMFGSFEIALNAGEIGRGIAVGRFDPDGYPDVAVLLDPGSATLAAVRVMASEADPPGFTAFSDLSINPPADGGMGQGSADQILAADFDRDGVLDLAILLNGVNMNQAGFAFAKGNGDPGQGDGSFNFDWSANVNVFGDMGTHVSRSLLSNVNDDLDPDLVFPITDSGPPTVSLVQALLGTGGMTFGPASSLTNPETMATYKYLRIGSLNADANPDLLFFRDTDTADDVRFFSGNGSGAFTADGSCTHGTPLADMDLADFDGDGTPDLALLRPDTTQPVLTVRYGVQTGSQCGFGVNYSPAQVTVAPTRLLIADVDDDTDQDVGIATAGDQVVVLLNSCRQP